MRGKKEVAKMIDIRVAAVMGRRQQTVGLSSSCLLKLSAQRTPYVLPSISQRRKRECRRRRVAFPEAARVPAPSTKM